MRMSALLLLVTAIGILIPSEAQAKRYRIERSGSHSWTVTDEAELLDDPDRFAFGSDPQLMRAWGTDPNEVCPQARKAAPDWRTEGLSCSRKDDLWTSSDLFGPRRQLAMNERGDDPDCDADRVLVYKLGHVTSYEYQRGVLGPVHTTISPVPDFPALVQARAALKTCLESHHNALVSQIKKLEEQCDAAEAAKTEKERRIAADNGKCRADLAARIQERVEKAPARPIAEIEAVPPKFRLPEEVQRMEDFAVAQSAKKMKGHKKPKADK